MRILLSALAIATFSSSASSQTTTLGGTWQLDEASSHVSAQATLSGLIGVGAPGVLHITHPTNGTLIVESQVNESHSRLYVPGRPTTTPIFLGTAGAITMTSRWDGATLVSEGTRSATSSESAVKESYALSDGGRTLTIEIEIDGDESTLRYHRIDSVGPCDRWPSPCKDFSSLERR